MSSSTRTVQVVIPTGFGINCEAETAEAFRLAGATVDGIHLNDLVARPDRLARAQILALAGGFSFGDHLGAARVLANRLQRRLGPHLSRFVEDGGLVLGICNGFQTMSRLGLVPGGHLSEQTVALAPNRHGCFYDGWVTLGVDPDSPCVFTAGMTRLDVPVRHGEGRLVAPDPTLDRIRADHLAPVHYVDTTGALADTFPDNPNGSVDAIAGLCDSTGRIFGLMPHPEAFLHPHNHPLWRHRSPTEVGDGLALFENAVAAAVR